MPTTPPLTINEQVAKNVESYITAIGKSNKWIRERANIDELSFHRLLKGKGDIDNQINKLNKLFHIEDLYYFYTSNFQPPKTIEEINKSLSLKNYQPPSIKDDLAFQETMTILEDFISMIDTLKTVEELALSN